MISNKTTVRWKGTQRTRRTVMRWQDLISSLYVCVCSAETHLSWLAFWLTSSTPVNNLKNREALDIGSVKPSLVDILKPQWKQMSIYLGRFCCKRHLRCLERVYWKTGAHTNTHITFHFSIITTVRKRWRFWAVLLSKGEVSWLEWGWPRRWV